MLQNASSCSIRSESKLPTPIDLKRHLIVKLQSRTIFDPLLVLKKGIFFWYLIFYPLLSQGILFYWNRYEKRLQILKWIKRSRFVWHRMLILLWQVLDWLIFPFGAMFLLILSLFWMEFHFHQLLYFLHQNPFYILRLFCHCLWLRVPTASPKLANLKIPVLFVLSYRWMF